MLKKDLQRLVDGMKEIQLRDYNRLLKRYEAAERNLKNNPDKCGGEDHIRGFMSGLIEGMVLLNPNLRSSVCMRTEDNEKI